MTTVPSREHLAAAPRRTPAATTPDGPKLEGRVRTDGKQFAVNGSRFPFRGVTYGTFKARSDGALLPPPDIVRSDLAAMTDAGFTVVRTYTAPTDDLLDAAGASGLRVMAGCYWSDWRYLVGSSRRQERRMVREACAEVRRQARRLRDDDRVAALVLGNEVPADAIRWVGSARVAAALSALAQEVRTEDPDLLVTYATYPTSEYLPLDDLDFLTVNVYLEDRAPFRRYLNRLHTLAGDRPLVLGEVGFSGDGSPRGERRHAEALDWMLEVATERGAAGTCVFSWTDDWWVGGREVTGWHFGLTDRDRSPRPALAVAQKWNGLTVADLAVDWPRITVVVCAYNAADTLDECLRHTCALDYPDLEVVVVDDGSTDDTAAIASRHPRAVLHRIPHAGLSVARNEGARIATGDLVAYLDSDAYPSPEWPYFLALGLDGPNVAGVGGPNVPPPGDGPGAQMVARAPGGPVHVLLSDDRAEHVPGCNMAFTRRALDAVGGFDPVFHAAGDDVDVCWKVLDAGADIAFHPAALVWHHRRTGLRAYLRQQYGYGKAESLVAARHPDRFTPAGTARWEGTIPVARTPRGSRDRIYRGRFGTAPFQSVYRGGGHGLDLAHQVGVPAAVAVLPTGLAAAVHPLLGLPALAALSLIVGLAAVDTARTTVPPSLRRGRRRFRFGVAVHHLAQPLARTWGRIRHRAAARRDLPSPPALPGPVRTAPGGVLVLPLDRPRVEVVEALLAQLRRRGVTVGACTAWDDHDARLVGSLLVDGRLVTSACPDGTVQIRVDRRPRPVCAAAVLVSVLAAALVHPLPGTVLVVLAAGEATRGWWRVGVGLRRSVEELVR